MPSVDTIISAMLAYLLIGSLCWLVLWCSGVVGQVQVKRCSPMLSRVLASLWAILMWPSVVCAVSRAILVKGARR